MDEEQFKELSDRVDAMTAEIATLKASNQSQDTQLQAANTALQALKVAQQNKQAVKSLAEDFKDTSQIAAARIVALEKVATSIWRVIRVLLIVAGGYLLLQTSITLWATSSTTDDNLADWLSKGAIVCFGWALIVVSNQEQRAIDMIQSLPFFRR